MEKLSRRTFGKYLLAATTLPLTVPQAQAPSTERQTFPPIIAGYTLTAEEKRLAEKFFATHEKNMASLRARDLPNALAPALFFACPTTGETGDAKQ
jgi:hypothetical protein